jgi:hypothetical protein
VSFAFTSLANTMRKFGGRGQGVGRPVGTGTIVGGRGSVTSLKTQGLRRMDRWSSRGSQPESAISFVVHTPLALYTQTLYTQRRSVHTNATSRFAGLGSRIGGMEAQGWGTRIIGLDTRKVQRCRKKGTSGARDRRGVGTAYISRSTNRPFGVRA